jgi:hypothetical protein
MSQPVINGHPTCQGLDITTEREVQGVFLVALHRRIAYPGSRLCLVALVLALIRLKVPNQKSQSPVKRDSLEECQSEQASGKYSGRG